MLPGGYREAKTEKSKVKVANHTVAFMEPSSPIFIESRKAICDIRTKILLLALMSHCSAQKAPQNMSLIQTELTFYAEC